MLEFYKNFAAVYGTCWLVALGYSEAASKKIPLGFGALIPRTENIRMLGSLWDGRIFPERQVDGKILVRAMFGGTLDPEIGEMDADQVIALARKETAALLGIEEAPVFEEIIRWPRAIPQYDLKHLERVAGIEKALEEIPTLHLAGNSLEGIAFGKAAESGLNAADRLAEALGL